MAIALIQLAACSMIDVHPANNEKVSVFFSEPNHIQFQGKGAGAGIALMSTIGPVGIALGVAIDEGIAKDIRKAIGQEETDIQNHIEKQISRDLEQYGYSVSPSAELIYPKLFIKRYGFKITNGSTDATAAEWELELHSGPDTKVTLNYPKDFEKDSIKTHVLSDLKVDGKLGLELLNESLEQVMERVKARLTKL